MTTGLEKRMARRANRILQSLHPIPAATGAPDPDSVWALREFDKMPDDWRLLVKHYGNFAYELYVRRTPVFPGSKRMSSLDALQELVAEHGKPVQARKQVGAAA